MSAQALFERAAARAEEHGLAYAGAVTPGEAHALQQAGQATIVGTVYDSLSVHGPLPRAQIVLVGRSRYVQADSLGRFRIEGLAPGRYSLGLLHPVLDSFDLSAPLRMA